MTSLRIALVSSLAVIGLPGLARAQLPTQAQVQAEASKAQGAAAQDAAKASVDAKASAAAAKTQGQAAASSQVQGVKTKAKDTGKKGVQTGTTKGATKVKPVVGEPATNAAAGVATEKGNAEVEKGVDSAADKFLK